MKDSALLKPCYIYDDKYRSQVTQIEIEIFVKYNI